MGTVSIPKFKPGQRVSINGTFTGTGEQVGTLQETHTRGMIAKYSDEPFYTVRGDTGELYFVAQRFISLTTPGK